MTARPPLPQPVLMPSPVDIGEPYSTAIAYYRTDHELSFYLRALQHLGNKHMVVVVGLRNGTRVAPIDLPENVRLILTAAGPIHDDNVAVGWVIPDPFRAVVLAMTGLHPEDGLTLLFPSDWSESTPEALLEKARRWRSSPHSLVDDLYFNGDDSN